MARASLGSALFRFDAAAMLNEGSEALAQGEYSTAIDETVLRDTLLPKLLSGELRVGDAERFVESGV